SSFESLLTFSKGEEAMEFLVLLIVTLLIAVVTAFLVIFFFRKPIDKIFHRILGDEIATAWRKFLTFALFVVGVSSGVNLYKLEQFVTPETENWTRPVLTPEWWGLEIYRTIIGTLAGMAWALLIFFIIALLAFVIVKGREMKNAA
ncbi:MAG TPA: hypothetical protein VLA12_02735, partial [Planctomycetaceae bacterium]|nr:hypothetical protein [Planctomycetaceae bacterium]